MKDILDLEKLKKKKRVNRKAKGGAFERLIANMLNEKFETKEFCRTPGSSLLNVKKDTTTKQSIVY